VSIAVAVPVELPAEDHACVLDPLAVLAHLVALTRRVRLGTSAARARYWRCCSCRCCSPAGSRPSTASPAARWSRGSPTGCIRTAPTSPSSRPDPAVFHAAAVEAGRDGAAPPVVLRGDAVADQDAGEGRPLFRGTVAQWADDARRVAALGISELVLQVAAPPDAALDALAGHGSTDDSGSGART
jgi:hypothetical protein